MRFPRGASLLIYCALSSQMRSNLAPFEVDIGSTAILESLLDRRHISTLVPRLGGIHDRFECVLPREGSKLTETQRTIARETLTLGTLKLGPAQRARFGKGEKREAQRGSACLSTRQATHTRKRPRTTLPTRLTSA